MWTKMVKTDNITKEELTEMAKRIDDFEELKKNGMN